MAFLDQWKLAMCTAVGGNCVQGDVDVTTPFRARVQQAMAKVALDIQGETPSASSAVDLKRAALAVNVMSVQLVGDPPQATSGLDLWLDTFALAVTSNVTITGSSTDADIEFQVTAVWNDLAGVTGRD